MHSDEALRIMLSTLQTTWRHIPECFNITPHTVFIFTQGLLQVMTNHTGGQRNGVMVPIPQYPLYSATLAEFDLDQVSVRSSL